MAVLLSSGVIFLLLGFLTSGRSLVAAIVAAVTIAVAGLTTHIESNKPLRAVLFHGIAAVGIIASWLVAAFAFVR
jgi:hypothetical protein